MPGRYKRPVTPAERERREQASADKLTALHERLTEQVRALRTGQDWRAWLDTARRFHSYSFNNVLLIGAQRPDATAVAGYEAWKALGRQVDKGERGIQILAPVLRRDRADNGSQEAAERHAAPGEGPGGRSVAAVGSDGPSGDEKTGSARAGQVAGFRVTYVWDLSQTSGDPLPAQPLPQLLQGQAPPGLWDSLAAVLADRGFALERGDCGQANGWTDYRTHTVRVRDDVDDAQAAKTLAHEVGHVLLHAPADFPSAPAPGVPMTTSAAGAAGTSGAAGTTAACRGTKEVEAESVAYLVAATHGLPTDDYTFAYVAGWAGSVDGTEPERVVRDTGQRVLAATRTVLAATAPETAPEGDGAEQAAALVDRAQAGADRAAAARQHADATLAATQPPPATTTADAAQLATLARLHADAAAFYSAQLHSGTPDAARAAAMLHDRAIPPSTAAAYELGYAPAGWTALTDHLRGRGYTDADLLDAGVGMTTRRGTVVDRFRDRLMLPVREETGERVIAFLGRALTDSPDTPKYLNSPETALYRKAEVLYGLGAAPSRQALAAGARPVLVEGALDAIAVTCAGAGQHAGVAPSGTALTAGQVAALDRRTGLTDRGVLVAFDADPAGREAALRSFELLRATGTWPEAATLPDGQDPAGLLQHAGAPALQATLTASRPLADLVVDERLDRWADRLQWAEGKLGAARDVAQLVAAFPPEHIGDQVLRVAGRLGLEHSEVTGAVVDALSREADAPGRLARRSRREDLDRPSPVASGPATGPRTAAQLARGGYPTALTGATGAPQAAGAAAGDPQDPTRHRTGPRPAPAARGTSS